MRTTLLGSTLLAVLLLCGGSFSARASEVCNDPVVSTLPAPVTSVPSMLAEGSAFQALIESMASGTWAELATTGMAAAFTSVGSSANLMTWSSGGSWDPVAGRFMWCGADHGNLPPECVQLDGDTSAWSRFERYPYVAGIVHGYDHSVIDPATGDFYYYRYNSRQVYKRSGGVWSALPLFPYSAYTPCCTGAAWSPELGGLVLVGQEVLLYKPATNAWTKLNPVKLPVIAPYFNHFAEYNGGCVLFGSGGLGASKRGLYKLCGNGVIVRLADSPMIMSISKSMVMASPTDSGKFFVLTDHLPQSGDTPEQIAAGARKFWLYDLPADTWTLLPQPPPEVWTPNCTNCGVGNLLGTPVTTDGVLVVARCRWTSNCKTFVYKP